MNGMWKWFVGMAAIPLFSLAVAWGQTGQRITHVEEDVEKIEQTTEGLREKVTQMDKKVDTIQLLQIIDLKARGVIPNNYEPPKAD